MKPWSNSYHMLVASLPPLPARLDGARLPISLERLQDRLRLLEPDDAREMAQMFEVLQWSRQFSEETDRAVAERYEQLIRTVSNPVIHEVLTVVIDIRMILTALRLRRRGEGPPTVGIGQWFDQIRRQYKRPDFGLGFAYPRLAEVGALFERGDVLGVYRGLLRGTWAYLHRRSQDYWFEFEAVVLYVVRWSLIFESQKIDQQRGREVFDALVTEALGEYANVFA